MRDMCLNLDRLDGILIEMVVEGREPGIAVVVIAIDLDRGTILAAARRTTSSSVVPKTAPAKKAVSVKKASKAKTKTPITPAA